ncbi:MAG: phosphomevalonate kinase [Bifidobacteriaceae bacterium]|nr:phosphomevalonate kinase [Bifidobacteriaceae bacterium]MCI1979146.1 phosphomevalonate kinase [Bifidobacteriaceae bacterium]
MITEQAPGKLYIAGEYAVVEKTNPAVVVAIDEFVRVRVQESDTTGIIHSKQYAQDSVHWTRKGNQLVVDNRDNPFHYILSAIDFTERYVSENGGKLKVYNLIVNSELDSADGKKYGLGSSAAVTVATVKALLRFYGFDLVKDVVFKLAAIAHLTVQGNGSLGDVAASVYGGWLAYCSFDRDWLRSQLEVSRLTDLVNAEWPGLKIQSLEPVEGLELVIGWTQKPASTSQLVEKTDEEKVDNQALYDRFVADSRACVEQIIHGFETKNIELIMCQIRHNRELLKQLSKFSTVPIEIPRLTSLIDIAEKYHGAAKTSGAGNGDCGIVLANEATDVAAMKAEWRENGILPLDLHVHQVD